MSFHYRQISLLVILFSFFVGCKKNPQAKLDFADGTYEGEINQDGQKNGTGIYRWIDGSFYEGEYQDDKRHGKGRFLWANGESYKGAYHKDERTGKGTYHWPDGSFYEGDFLSGKRHGWGQFQSTDQIVYTGEWFDDLQHGQGSLTYPDGRVLKGIWRKGNLLSKPSDKPEASLKPKVPQASPKSVVEIEESPIPTLKAPQMLPSKSPSQKPNVIPSPVQDVATVTPKIIPSSEFEESREDTILAELNLQTDTDGVTESIEQPAVTENLISVGTPVDSKSPDWSGTVAEADARYITELIDGIDTVSDRASGVPFTGKMRILNAAGKVQGEVNLLNGRLHGEEVFYDLSGNVIETNTWVEGSLKN